MHGPPLAWQICCTSRNFSRGILVLAKNPLIRRSRATLPTNSSTTAVMAGRPPSRSYSVFFGASIWAWAVVVHSTAATAAAMTIRMRFPFLVGEKTDAPPHALPLACNLHDDQEGTEREHPGFNGCFAHRRGT